MNITNIVALIESGLDVEGLPIPKKNLKSFIEKGYIHPSECNEAGQISIFGAILLLIFDELIRLRYSQTIIKELYSEYYPEIPYTQKFKFKEGFEVYNFPLVVPVLLTLIGEKHYIIISGDGELTFESEEDLVARISFSDATGDSVHGRILLDIEVFLKRLGIDPTHHSKGTLKKLGTILENNRIPFLKGGSYYYEREYYDNPNKLQGTIGNIAQVPNRTTILKSNNKGSITHISISTKIELK
ncbi:hypothetical protein KA057_01980 [Candidatus Gracilibacteria bacterium]|nr:hypothetical protein [Candidatus Gracilibacteria bacterium]